MTQQNSRPKTADDHPMYCIRFVANKGREPGYLVKIGRRNVDHTKWFGFGQFGGDAQALSAAQAWRDAQVRALPLVSKLEYVSKIRPNNTSGASGVVRTTKRSRKRSGAVVCTDYWLARPPRSVKARQCYFSIPKYGEERAWELAVKARREMELLAVGHYVPNVPDAFVELAVERALVATGQGA